MKNLLYHCSDNMELLVKQLEDADKQLAQCMQQIKSVAEEKELRQKQLEDLQEDAQVVINMVDPPEGGVVDNRTLLERLLCGSCAWTCQVLLTKGRCETTRRWHGCRLFRIRIQRLSERSQTSGP
jgi:hypothetical protein